MPESASPAVLIVANPYSGRGNNRARVEQLRQALSRLGLDAGIRWGWSAQGERLDSVNCVVVAGGDGSVAHVVRSLPHPAPALAILPLGNENLLAKHLGHHAGIERLAKAVARGRTRTIDLGYANDFRFTLMLTAGIDAEVVHRVARWRMMEADKLRRVSHLSYVRPTLAAIGRYRFPPVELAAGETVVRGALVMVINVPRYARGLAFAPQARDDDGLLDWIVFEKPGRLQALRYLAAVLRGSHLRRPDVKHGRSERLIVRHVDAKNPVPVQIDGDDAAFTPVDIHVQPGTIKVIDTSEEGT